MSVEFIGRCDQLRAEDLDAYDETEEEIDYARFLQIVGPGVVADMEEELGYAGSGLTLERDWHISYGEGQWKGQAAVCMHWSAYHHIWTIHNT